MANRICPFCHALVPAMVIPTLGPRDCRRCGAPRRDPIAPGDRPGATVGLTVDTHNLGTTVFLELTGELDLAGIESLEAAVELTVRSDADLVVADLGRVRFIDATGVHGLLDAYERLGDRLRIIPVDGGPRRVFELTGTVDQLPFVREEPAHRPHDCSTRARWPRSRSATARRRDDSGA